MKQITCNILKFYSYVTVKGIFSFNVRYVLGIPYFTRVLNSTYDTAVLHEIAKLY